MMKRKRFEPKIVSFVCDWCSLQSADFIGLTRIYFPRMVTFVRMSCSGRVNPEIISEAFLNLCDGVLVMGCRKGSCNYLTGNYQAERVVKAFKKALKLISVNPERLLMNLESDTEIIRVYEKFYREIRRVGPLWPEDSAKREELRHQFLMIRAALLDEELKWLVAREWTLVSRENAYGEITSQEKFGEVLENRIEEQFLICRICNLLKGKTCSVVEISKKLGEPTELVFGTIVEMIRRGLLTHAGIKERNPLYKIS